MSILVAANFDADEWAAWWPALQAALPGEHLIRDRSEVPAESIDVALVANPPLGALQGLPKLALIQSLWAGVDKLLADASVPAEVPLARMVDPAMNEAMAETALWAVLGLHRGTFGYAAQQREHVWRQHPQRRADEIHVAVLGLGQMGRTAAQRLARNGYRVTGWSTRAAAVVEGVETAAGDASLAEVLATARIVVNLLPLTPATRGLFGAAIFAAMPPGAGFVNLARGAHVVDADLLAALEGGHLHHAVLDVFHTEPLPADHPFWSHPNITVLPHVAAQTDPRSAALIAARNVLALRRGQPLADRVDRRRGY
ncbi:glyoxylate/hydroxypyruvate reductase A [soil metagenome]